MYCREDVNSAVSWPLVDPCGHQPDKQRWSTRQAAASTHTHADCLIVCVCVYGFSRALQSGVYQSKNLHFHPSISFSALQSPSGSALVRACEHVLDESFSFFMFAAVCSFGTFQRAVAEGKRRDWRGGRVGWVDGTATCRCWNGTGVLKTPQTDGKHTPAARRLSPARMLEFICTWNP